MAQVIYKVMTKYQNKTTKKPISSSLTINPWKSPMGNFTDEEYRASEIVPILYITKTTTSSSSSSTTYQIQTTDAGTVTANAEAKLKDIVNYNNPGHVFYDYLFTYNGFKQLVFTLNTPTGSQSSLALEVAATSPIFDPVTQGAQIWKVDSQHFSLKAAMNAADKLIRMLGLESVDVGKRVPFDTYVDIE